MPLPSSPDGRCRCSRPRPSNASAATASRSLSPHELRGLAFGLVVFCDLAEGGFPPRPTPDPVLLDRERDWWPRACGARLPGSAELAAEYDALFALACDAAVDELVLLAPRLDTSTGRPRLPSRALLGLARELAARPVAFAELETDGGLRRRRAPRGDRARRADRPARPRPADAARLARPRTARPAWLERVRGGRHGNTADRARGGGGLRPPPPRARSHDGVLSAGNAARAAAPVFAASGLAERLRDVSVVSLCLLPALRARPRVPDEPDEALAIEPVDLGRVVHEILQGAYAAAARGGRPTRELVLAGLDEVAGHVPLPAPRRAA